jgi:hypothetical protein
MDEPCHGDSLGSEKQKDVAAPELRLCDCGFNQREKEQAKLLIAMSNERRWTSLGLEGVKKVTKHVSVAEADRCGCPANVLR